MLQCIASHGVCGNTLVYIYNGLNEMKRNLSRLNKINCGQY